jgi:hypothetical protein
MTPQHEQPANANARGCILAALIIAGLIGLGCLAIIFVGLATQPPNSPPVSPVFNQPIPKEDPPLTPVQARWITTVLEETDKIDLLFRRGEKDGSRYVEIGRKVEDAYFASDELLPSHDTRAILLGSTVKAYQRAVVLIAAGGEGSNEESPAALMTVAGMRKTLLRKIKNGKLTPEEQKLVDTLRREWRK